MSLQIKICGLNHITSVESAVESCADYLGCVFDIGSASYIDPITAKELFLGVPNIIKKVAVISNPTDQDIDKIIRHFAPDYIQLNGTENNHRLAIIKEKFDCKIIKRISLYSKKDLTIINEYEEFTDIFLFEPSVEYIDLYNQNRKIFEWQILRKLETKKPWMISGNISKHNLALILRASRAKMVNVDSSLESGFGYKDPLLIKSFIDSAREMDIDGNV